MKAIIRHAVTLVSIILAGGCTPNQSYQPTANKTYQETTELDAPTKPDAFTANIIQQSGVWEDPDVEGVREYALTLPVQDTGQAAMACIGNQDGCNPNAPKCCPGLGCLKGLYGAPARCVELGCVNGEYPCGPDAPNTICCTGWCVERGDGSYKCLYF
jgi:hypothetical protein